MSQLLCCTSLLRLLSARVASGSRLRRHRELPSSRDPPRCPPSDATMGAPSMAAATLPSCVAPTARAACPRTLAQVSPVCFLFGLAHVNAKARADLETLITHEFERRLLFTSFERGFLPHSDRLFLRYRPLLHLLSLYKPTGPQCKVLCKDYCAKTHIEQGSSHPVLLIL